MSTPGALSGLMLANLADVRPRTSSRGHVTATVEVDGSRARTG